MGDFDKPTVAALPPSRKDSTREKVGKLMGDMHLIMSSSAEGMTVYQAMQLGMVLSKTINKLAETRS